MNVWEPIMELNVTWNTLAVNHNNMAVIFLQNFFLLLYGLIHCVSNVTDSPQPFSQKPWLIYYFLLFILFFNPFSLNFFPPSSSASSIVSAASQHLLPRVTSATLTGSPGSASCQVEENNQSFPSLTFTNMFCQVICLRVYNTLYITELENVYTCEQDFLCVYMWLLLYLVTADSFILLNSSQHWFASDQVQTDWRNVWFE